MNVETRRVNIARDGGRLLEIEKEAFAKPWTPEVFASVLLTRGMVCRVAEVRCLFSTRKILIGFDVFQTDGERLVLLDVAVDVLYRRKGVGTRLLDDAKKIVERPNSRRGEIVTVTSEYNTDSQLFFRANEFEATDVLTNYHGDGHDAYWMVWSPPSKFVPRNRLAFAFEGKV